MYGTLQRLLTIFVVHRPTNDRRGWTGKMLSLQGDVWLPRAHVKVYFVINNLKQEATLLRCHGPSSKAARNTHMSAVEARAAAASFGLTNPHLEVRGKRFVFTGTYTQTEYSAK